MASPLVAVGITAILLALSGCAALNPEPEPQAYEIQPVLPDLSAPRSIGSSLFVAPVKALGPYAGPRMAYREQPYQLEYYSRNVWAAPPAELLAPWLLESLEDTRLFESVVAGVAAPPTRFRLDTELLALRHEFDSSPSQVRLVVRVQLVDLDQRRLLAAKRFELTHPAASGDASGGVTATNFLVGELLERIAAFCIETLTQP